jgi:putative transposase
MRKSKFRESQIVAILKEGESGLAVAEVYRKHCISAATYCAWKSKYAGVSVSDLTRMRELEAENAKLKRMYAKLALENTALKDVVSRKWWRRLRGGRRCNSWSRSTVCQSSGPAQLQACRGRRTSAGQWTAWYEMPK